LLNAATYAPVTLDTTWSRPASGKNPPSSEVARDAHVILYAFISGSQVRKTLIANLTTLFQGLRQTLQTFVLPFRSQNFSPIKCRYHREIDSALQETLDKVDIPKK